MLYSSLANVVLILHGAFIAFVVLGGLLVLWKPRLLWLHLPALAWGAAVVSMGWVCPLTPLENQLRSMAGQQGYDGGFIDHYLVSLIYPEGLTRPAQMLLAALLIIGNALIYTTVYRRIVRARRSSRALRSRP